MTEKKGLGGSMLTWSYELGRLATWEEIAAYREKHGLPPLLPKQKP